LVHPSRGLTGRAKHAAGDLSGDGLDPVGIPYGGEKKGGCTRHQRGYIKAWGQAAPREFPLRDAVPTKVRHAGGETRPAAEAGPDIT